VWLRLSKDCDFYYVWQLTELAHADRRLRRISGGWGIVVSPTAQTGPPITLYAGADRSQTAIGADNAQYLGGNVFTSGPCANKVLCVSYLIPSAFAQPSLGTYGNLARGALPRHLLFNTDLGMFKKFRSQNTYRFNFEQSFLICLTALISTIRTRL
jgi:hypothetical protein